MFIFSRVDFFIFCFFVCVCVCLFFFFHFCFLSFFHVFDFFPERCPGVLNPAFFVFFIFLFFPFFLLIFPHTDFSRAFRKKFLLTVAFLYNFFVC